MTAYSHRPLIGLSGNFFYYLVAASLAILSPYLTASENYTALFLFIGAIVGLFLFSYPLYCFWLLFYFTSLMGIVVSFFPKIGTLRWGVVLLGLLLGFRTLLEVAVSGKNRMEFKLDKGLFIVYCFVLIAIVSSVINSTSLSSLIVSTKNYFQFIPIIFTLVILPQFKHTSIIKGIYIGLLILALIQVPVSLYQRFILGAQFIQMGYGDVTVGDAVSGTFANKLFGGASKTLSLYLIFCSSLLISFAKYNIISWRKAVIASLFTLIPIFFNETKISFIYFPIITAFFSKEYLRENKMKAIGIFAVGFVAILGLGYAYKRIYSDSDRKFNKYINSSWEYNFGKVGYGGLKLNRLTALTFWGEQQKRYGLIPFLIGHGLNAANEGNAGVYAEQGRMAVRYPGYGIGLTMVSRLLWETGVIGTVCFFVIFLYPFRRITFFLKKERFYSDTFHLAVLLGLQAGIILCCIDFFSSPAFISIEVFNFLCSLILGMSLMMTQEIA